MNRDLAQMTVGEVYMVMRWRAGFRISQRRQARYLEMTREAYLALEASEDSALPSLVSDLAPTDAERLRLARVRSGIPVDAIAKDLGVSRMWLYRLERGASDRVRDYWTDRGYFSLH